MGRLLGQLFLVTGDLHEAEEVVQEAFARASLRWSWLRDYNAPEAWVRRVAMNLAADRARKLRRQARALLRMGPLGPSGFPDRFGMASDLASVMEQCQGGQAQVRLWAKVLGQTWVLAAREPLPGKDWICWSDGLWDKGGGAVFGEHGGSGGRLKPLQASQLTQAIRGKGELAVVGGPVTREAVRLRILSRDGPPIDLAPFDLGAQFPVRFYAAFYLQPAKTAWRPERVVAYDRSGRRIAECYATTRQGDVCDRPPGAPQPP